MTDGKHNSISASRQMLCCLFAIGLSLQACVAQDSPPRDAKQTVVVWVVTPATDADRRRVAERQERRIAAKVATLPTTVPQSTAGDFGQNASTLGQNAGSYGKPASDVGTNASDSGTAASNHGQNAGSFGQNASTVGQNASTAGQNAGNFGQTASTFGSRIDGTPNQQQTSQNAKILLARGPDAVRDRMARELGAVHLGTVRVPGVADIDLREQLRNAEGTDEAPDLLLWTVPIPQWWKESGLGWGLVGWPRSADGATLLAASPQWMRYQPTLLKRAPHAAAGRELMTQMLGYGVAGKPVPPSDATRAAVAAWQLILGGQNFGAMGDVDAADFSGAAAQAVVLGEDPSGAQVVQTDALASYVSDRVAVVWVRAMLAGEGSFGEVHSVVTLRRDSTNRWKALEVLPNLTPQAAGTIAAQLGQNATGKGPAPAQPLVVLASPIDGDVRPKGTELWWDNHSSVKGLLAVEWQRKGGDAWSETHLQLVPDADPRSQTRVAAEFATQPGLYRWRVWAMQGTGRIMLTPWRSVTILR